jgi:ferredoxin
LDHEAVSVRLEIVGSDGTRTSMDAAAGDRVLDLCDEQSAPIAFSCRSATCGTCRVTVERGADLVRAAGAEEQATLHTLGAAPTERLACQLVIDAENGCILLKASRPDAFPEA